MKIVIPDDYEGSFTDSPQLARLGTLGEVAHFTGLPGDEAEMAERIADADVILTVRYQTDFKNTSLLDAARELRFISIWGTRPRAVDMKRARVRGVSVSVTPGAGSPSVAEHTMMMALALAKRLPFQGPAMGAGEWERVRGVELLGKTLSVIGFGHIGSKVVPMARGFGMEALAWSRHMTPERAACAGARAATLDECMLADFVTIQLHVTPETRGIISKERIAQMKPTAFLINTSRAALVDMDALLAALRERRIAGAGLDVFEPEEPLPGDSPFRSLDNVVLTPHVAAHTEGAVEREARIAVDNVEAFVRGNPQNLVFEDA
ncbi:MAG: hypothetical protein F4X91_06795 [Nitrospinae bacterium]|nr:hypothetical protein [Nitrospinota bacterium]